MKTFLALVLGALTLTSQAVSFTWSSAEQIKFGDTIVSSMTEGAKSVSAYLVYLGTDNSVSFGDDTTGTLANISDSIVSGPVSSKTGGSAASRGTFSGSYSLNGNQGYSYVAVLTYVDAENTTWYNISGDVFEVGATMADNATGVSTTFSFSSQKNGSVSKLGNSQVGTGWYNTVPEPSTAMLALAGLALLLKRRKA